MTTRIKRIITTLFVMSLMTISVYAGGSKEMIVGERIKNDSIYDFYYTISSSTNPPEFQRYRFFSDDGKYYFYHEKREGNTWPLKEKHITQSGTIEISTSAWNDFLSLIANGSVIAREDDATSGGKGPYIYIYWKGDKDKYQVFSFSSLEKEKLFLELCHSLMK